MVHAPICRCFDPSLPEGEALWLQLSHPLDRPATSPATSSTPTSTAGPAPAPSPAQPHTHYHHTATASHASAHGGSFLQPAASAQSHHPQPLQAAGDWASTVVRAASGRLAPLQEGHLPGFSSSTGNADDGYEDHLQQEEGHQGYNQQQQQQQAELVEQLCSVRCAPPCCCVWLVADGADSADAWVDALLLARHVVGSRSESVLAEALTPAAPGHVAAAVGRLSSDGGRR